MQNSWRLLALALLCPQWAGAHGDVHLRLAAVIAQLEKQPDDVSLLVRRGELHREHRDWGAALEDFGRAGRLDPNVPADFLKSRVLAEANFPREARSLLNLHLQAHPGHSAALLVRGRVLAALGDSRAAAADFTTALAHSPAPEVYFERAQLLAGVGDISAALAGLDEGLKRLGSLPALQDLAVELELRRNHYAGAAARLATLLARAPRKEFLLARRGEVWLAAGKFAAARADFLAAQAALETLPAARREVPAVVELAVRIVLGLRRTAEPHVATTEVGR